MSLRCCKKCNTSLHIDLFHVDSKGIILHTCQSCYLDYLKKYRQKNSAKISEQKATWHQANKHLIKQRYNSDIQFKLRHQLRVRLNRVLNKGGSAVSDLGCSVEELKLHLESKWLLGMTWDNWNKEGWHIDHIVPLCSFDLTNPEQLKKACHYTNLQPLWAVDNLSKGGRVC